MAQPIESAARLAAEKYVRITQEGRYNEIGELFAENGVWVGFNGEPKYGRAAITEFYITFLSQLKSQRNPTIRIATCVAEGDKCVIELEASFPETGEFRLAALDHITVDAQGKITRLAVFAPPKLGAGS